MIQLGMVSLVRSGTKITRLFGLGRVIFLGMIAALGLLGQQSQFQGSVPTGTATPEPHSVDPAGSY